MKEVERHQKESKDSLDLVQMTIDLQSKIIINCTVGMGHAHLKVPFEHEDGNMGQVSIADSISKLL